MTITFNISDNEKANKLWELVNPNYDEEHGWDIDNFIVDVYEDYAVVKNAKESNKYQRVYYTRDDENDTVTLGETVDCFIIDVTTEEYEALKNARKANNDTYAGIDVKMAENENLAVENSTLSSEKVELEQENATLKSEGEEIQKNYDLLKAELDTANENRANVEEQLAQVTAEKEELANYKREVVKSQKESIIEEYIGQLSEETIVSFKENMDQYTLEDLDVQLTYAVKKAHPEIFKHSESFPKKLPKVEHKVEESLDDILKKYN